MITGRAVGVAAWAGFLAAVAAEGLAFAFLDPSDFRIAGVADSLPRLAVYTLGFMVFWMTGWGASVLAVFLLSPDRGRNERP